MKIKTEKYIVYMPGGKVYKGSVFFRDLKDDQIEYLKGGRWQSKADKIRLDELIDTDFEDTKITGLSLHDALEKSGFLGIAEPSEKAMFCNHKFSLLEIQEEKYIFYCVNCLKLENKERYI